MTDPVFAIVCIASFFAVMAALHFFKTLDADLLHAWRNPIAAGVVSGLLLWLLGPILIPAIVTGVLLGLAALYVRLNGRESEPVDGMLLGAVTGAAAAIPLVFRGHDECVALAECLAAGAVTGYGITFASFHVADKTKQLILDAVTLGAGVVIAIVPRVVVHAGANARDVAILVSAAVPLVILGAVFKQWPAVRAELRHEASLGFIDDRDVRRTAHPFLRLGSGGWVDRHAHREFVRLANEIALRKRQQRHRSDDIARLYQLEIIKLRMQIREMSRIDRAMRQGGGDATETDDVKRQSNDKFESG